MAIAGKRIIPHPEPDLKQFSVCYNPTLMLIALVGFVFALYIKDFRLLIPERLYIKSLAGSVPTGLFWHFTSFSYDTLGQTELSYLENAFCNMAIDAHRYELQNSNEPTPGNITEEKESELAEYSDLAHLILGVLGYKVFDKATVYRKKENKEVSPSNTVVPPLPTEDLKIGAFIQLVMENLSNSGYTFSENDINLMCTKEWSHDTFGLNYPFIIIVATKAAKGMTQSGDESVQGM